MHPELQERFQFGVVTMWVGIWAYTIYWKGSENPEYVMHFSYLNYSGTLKNRNMLGNSLPVGPAEQRTEDYLKHSGCRK